MHDSNFLLLVKELEIMPVGAIWSREEPLVLEGLRLVGIHKLPLIQGHVVAVAGGKQSFCLLVLSLGNCFF